MACDEGGGLVAAREERPAVESAPGKAEQEIDLRLVSGLGKRPAAFHVAGTSRKDVVTLLESLDADPAAPEAPRDAESAMPAHIASAQLA